MGILIGMDEAGYGPNLGPLVVAASAWQVDEDAADREQGAARERLRIADCGLRIEKAGVQSAIRNPKSAIGDLPCDLYRLLRNVVVKSSNQRRIAIADSKVLYKPGLGLRQLERGVHAVLAAVERSCSCWSEMVAGCGADPDRHHRALVWHDGFDCRLPVDATTDELARLGPRLVKACDAVGVRPLAIRARLVFPAEFNELVDHYGTKGAALSHVTIGLLREVLDSFRSGVSPPTEAGSPPTPDPRLLVPVYALCDKHGGRNFYTALLQHHFSEHWIEPVYESHAESRYEWGSDAERVHVAFRTNGERFLPTALASMTAKYLRELAMRAFNEFWCARVPGLRPTAGYYGDAPRFKRQIETTQRELDIDDRVLWRNR